MTTATVYRRFVDLAEGQMHLREAGRTGTGTPLVLLHQASGASRTMVPLMATLGTRRPCLAPDLPGNGDSMAPAVAAPTMADYADAVLRMLDAAELDRIALYGFHAGASVAAEVALARPDRVTAVILDSLGLYDMAEAERFADAYVPDIPRHPHGLHLMQAWHYVRDTYLFWPWFETGSEHTRNVGLPPLDEMHDKVLEVLKSLDGFGAYYRAAFLHDKADRLPRLAVPTLVTAGRDNSQARHLPALQAMIPGAQSLTTPGTYDPARASETAALLADWLDEVVV